MKTIMMTLAVAAFAPVIAQDIFLPLPTKHGGVTLMQALSERKSTRDFQAREVSPEQLSSLLWAANGINRADGRRTAPTGRNVQDIDVYVMKQSGVYRYDAAANKLIAVNLGDHRAAAGKQDFAKACPLTLVYVQRLDKAMRADEVNTARHGGIHAGAIMQNVYLFCAKEKLATVARDYIDRPALAAALKLGNNERIMLAQSVGYPLADGRIGAEAAKRIALNHANLAENQVRRLRVERDREDGVQVYEVEFESGDFEYDYEIDAQTGTIRKAKKERD